MNMTLVALIDDGIVQCEESKLFPDTAEGRQAADAYFGELYFEKTPPEDQSKDNLIACLDNGNCSLPKEIQMSQFSDDSVRCITISQIEVK